MPHDPGVITMRNNDSAQVDVHYLYVLEVPVDISHVRVPRWSLNFLHSTTEVLLAWE